MAVAGCYLLCVVSCVLFVVFLSVAYCLVCAGCRLLRVAFLSVVCCCVLFVGCW